VAGSLQVVASQLRRLLVLGEMGTRVRTGVVLVATGVALGLLLTGCGSPPSVSELFHEYLASTTVKGDQDRGATSADRLAEFAAEGSPSDNEARLFSAYACGLGSTICPDEAVDTAREAAGPTGDVFKRAILAKHHDGQLELITLYVASPPGGAKVLVDSDGKKYSGGLDDFREHNVMLTADDLILSPRDLTSTSGENELIVASGHTSLLGTTWLVVAICIVAVLVVAALVVVTVRRIRFKPFE
jgi:hypothetical protein